MPSFNSPLNYLNLPGLIADRRTLAAGATAQALYAVNAESRIARNFYIRAVANRLVAPTGGVGARLGRISLFSRYVDGGPRHEIMFVALTDVDRIYGPFPMTGRYMEIDVVNEGGTNAIEYDLEFWPGDEPPSNPALEFDNQMKARRLYTFTDGLITPMWYFSCGTLYPQHPLNDLDRAGLDVEAIQILASPGYRFTWNGRLVGVGSFSYKLFGQSFLDAIVSPNSVEWFRSGTTTSTPGFTTIPLQSMESPFPILVPCLQQVAVGATVDLAFGMFR